MGTRVANYPVLHSPIREQKKFGNIAPIVFKIYFLFHFGSWSEWVMGYLKKKNGKNCFKKFDEQEQRKNPVARKP